MRLVVAVALLAGACGTKNTSSAPSCADAARAIDTLVQRTRELAMAPGLQPGVAEQIEQNTKRLDALVPRWRAVITNRCTDDKWPADVIACHAKGVTTLDELRACRAKLPPAQQAKMQSEELALMNGDPSLPGFGASPPPTSPDITRLEGELRQLNARLGQAVTRLADATTEPDRAVAKDDVRRLQAEMERVNQQLASERARLDRNPIAVDADNMRRAYDAVSAQVDATMQELAAAKTEAERQNAAARLQSLLAQQASLAMGAGSRAPSNSDPLAAARQIEQEMTKLLAAQETLDREVNAAVEAVIAAQSDAARAAAKTKLEDVKRRHAELQQNIQDTKAAHDRALAPVTKQP